MLRSWQWYKTPLAAAGTAARHLRHPRPQRRWQLPLQRGYRRRSGPQRPARLPPKPSPTWWRTATAAPPRRPSPSPSAATTTRRSAVTAGAVKTDRELIATGTLTVVDADAGESGFVAGEPAGLWRAGHRRYRRLDLHRRPGPRAERPLRHRRDRKSPPSTAAPLVILSPSMGRTRSSSQPTSPESGPGLRRLDPDLSAAARLSARRPRLPLRAPRRPPPRQPPSPRPLAASGESARAAETPAVGPEPQHLTTPAGSTGGTSAPSGQQPGQRRQCRWRRPGAALLPPVQRRRWSSRRRGIKVFTLSVSMMNAVSFGQNIHRHEPAGHAGRDDCQNPAAPLQQDSARAPEPDAGLCRRWPCLEASLAPAVPALPAGEAARTWTELPVSSDDHHGCGRLETAADSDTQPGRRPGRCRRADWRPTHSMDAPAADKVSSRRASGPAGRMTNVDSRRAPNDRTSHRPEHPATRGSPHAGVGTTAPCRPTTPTSAT